MSSLRHLSNDQQLRSDADRGLTEKTSQLLSKLDSYANLRDGWNGYDAPAPASNSIRNAKELILEANGTPEIPGRIEPSAMGGIGVTFTNGPREVVVEFYNNGTAHALFSDDTTEEMHTQTVKTNPADYRGLIESIRS